MQTLTDRQHEIIDAAGLLLTRSGVNGLTIKNLAKEMSFTESAVYRHFQSKEEIIVTLLNYLNEKIVIECKKASQEKEVEDKLIAIFQNLFRFFKAHPHFVVVVFSDGLMEESQAINAGILRLMQSKMFYIMPIIMEGQQSGKFTKKLSAEQLIHIIMGAVRLQMFKWRLSSFEMDLEKQSKPVLDAILQLISTER
ncbi:MAG: TetR/AcrR family transcriptional regulator [Flavobacteriia bacterium]|nr:TetR/AcrR family transcriptional regulator [Flavobacteriia bacterium]